MSEKQETVKPPEAEHKPPFGAWWKMYAFVLAFMGLLVLCFALLANSYDA